MKPMKIEKRLELSRPVDQILQCQITNEIQYHTEADGIRALGSLGRLSAERRNHTGRPGALG